MLPGLTATRPCCPARPPRAAWHRRTCSPRAWLGTGSGRPAAPDQWLHMCSCRPGCRRYRGAPGAGACLPAAGPAPWAGPGALRCPAWPPRPAHLPQHLCPSLPALLRRGVAYVKYDRASSAALAIENLHEVTLNEGQGPRLKVLLADSPHTR